MKPLVAVPVKPFGDAKRRLAGILDDGARADLARRSATHVVETASLAGAAVAVIAGDDEVADWANRLGVGVVADPGRGLNAAATAGIASAVDAGSSWCVAHADLALITPSDIATMLEGALGRRAILAPSRDGGTNLIAATGPFEFRFGPRSFGRHLAVAALAGLTVRVVVTPGTAIEIDTPSDLEAAASLEEGRWLTPFLS